MKTIRGKVRVFLPKLRMISIVVNNRKYYLRLNHREFNLYKSVLNKLPFIECEIIKKKKRNLSIFEVVSFKKIILIKRKKRLVVFDIKHLQHETRKFLRNIDYKLFIDLEFSLPSHDSRAEVIEYGIILEDRLGSVLFEEKSLLKPFFEDTINEKTLAFLNLKKKDFNSAKPYIKFYRLLKSMIELYDPKIIAWGKADLIYLEKSFKINRLQTIDIKSRYINLMQLVKNYVGSKQELGLFKVYQEMFKIKDELIQTHDAYTDTAVMQEIFHALIENSEFKIDKNIKKIANISYKKIQE